MPLGWLRPQNEAFARCKALRMICGLRRSWCQMDLEFCRSLVFRTLNKIRCPHSNPSPLCMEALQKRTGPRRILRSAWERVATVSQFFRACVITSTMPQAPQSHKKAPECGRHEKCPCASEKTGCDSCRRCPFGQDHAKHIFKERDSAENPLRWKGVREKDTGRATIKAARIQARAIVAAAMLTVLGGIIAAMILVLFG